jgi:hypothetical protein
MRELAHRFAAASASDLLILLIIAVRALGVVGFCFLAVCWAIDGNYVSVVLSMVVIPAWIMILTKIMDSALERLRI